MQEGILCGETHRPQTSPATLDKRHIPTWAPNLSGVDAGVTPCTEKSEERLYRSWQYYSEAIEASEVTRCVTANVPGAASPPPFSFPGVIALDWFLPSAQTPAVDRRSSRGTKHHRRNAGKAQNVPRDGNSGIAKCYTGSLPPQMTPWATAGRRFGSYAGLRLKSLTVHPL